nr:FHA domain-containing protein FhaB [Streptomyces sp. MH191]
MGVLKKFEQRLEGLVNGTFAKVFKSEVQPVEIAGALQRECDNNATIWNRDRTVVPNDFIVELSAPDYERLSPYSGQLGDELAGMVRDYAKQQRYTFMGTIKVHLEKAEDLDTGLYRVRSRTLASSTDQQAPGGRPAPAARPGAATGSRSTAPAIRSPARRWCWAAAPTPTCGSTTPASPAGTARSGPERPRRSRISGPPTASWWTDSTPPALRSATARGSSWAAPPSFTGKPKGEAGAMSELTLTVMRLGFLAVLWLFVIVAVQVIRSDLFGTRVTQRGSRREAGRQPQQAQRQAAAPPPQRQQPSGGGRQRRGAPTKLVVSEGTLTGTTVALQGQTITLGRAHDSTIVLDDDYASSRHARIYPDRDGQWIVEDLGSTNGTYLDRTRLTTPTPIPLGAPIRIGKTVIELRK